MLRVVAFCSVLPLWESVNKTGVRMNYLDSCYATVVNDVCSFSLGKLGHKSNAFKHVWIICNCVNCLAGKRKKLNEALLESVKNNWNRQRGRIVWWITKQNWNSKFSSQIWSSFWHTRFSCMLRGFIYARQWEFARKHSSTFYQIFSYKCQAVPHIILVFLRTNFSSLCIL